MFFQKKEPENNNIEGRVYDNAYIHKKLENIILKHVIINSLKLPNYKPSPLLFLQGRKGEGKTFMTEKILEGNNISYKKISSSILTGKKEGEAVDNLMLYYNKCEMNPNIKKYTALVIDDFHLSIAITKATAGHTTNADNLIEALMNIADRKEELKAPIILIGNDFTDAYPPLVRAGRASICTWEPTIDDKKQIVKTMIRTHGEQTNNITDDSIYAFVDHYKNQYIGFFEKAIENVCFNNFEPVTDFFVDNSGDVTIDQLMDIAQRTISANVISIERIAEEAENILKSNFKKLDD